VKIHHRTVGPFQENSYLVVDDSSGQAIMVDPGDEPDVLLDLIEESNATVTAIWLTHAHIDHIGGLAGLRRKWPVPVHMHPADQRLFERAGDVARMYGLPFERPEYPDQTLTDGQMIGVGTLQFEVLHVPGHAPGHVVFVGEGVMLGGDLLFAGSIGRTDLPFCDPSAMERSLERVAGLDPGLIVYPGHGPATTIGREIETNPFLSGIARPVRR
jgi:hydroxyacylglutathione hydrolase